MTGVSREAFFIITLKCDLCEQGNMLLVLITSWCEQGSVFIITLKCDWCEQCNVINHIMVLLVGAGV